MEEAKIGLMFSTLGVLADNLDEPLASHVKMVYEHCRQGIPQATQDELVSVGVDLWEQLWDFRQWGDEMNNPLTL